LNAVVPTNPTKRIINGGYDADFRLLADLADAFSDLNLKVASKALY